MNTIEAPKAKRKFSQSCNSKQDFIDMIWEMREAAEKAKPDTESPFSKDWQEGRFSGLAEAYDRILHELAKSPDTRTY